MALPGSQWEVAKSANPPRRKSYSQKNKPADSPELALLLAVITTFGFSAIRLFQTSSECPHKEKYVDLGGRRAVITLSLGDLFVDLILNLIVEIKFLLGHCAKTPIER